MISLFRGTVPLGMEHGTVGVNSHGSMYEVTTFRRDIETDGRRAIVEFADTVEEDLARRDFTINAIAWRPASGDWIDPFKGEDDLRARRLRAVGDPAERFTEDRLRVFRGIRFAGRFGLTVEPDTDRALREAVPDLRGLSAERVRDELLKVLDSPDPRPALALYASTGVLDIWYPELAERGNDAAGLRAVKAVSVSRPLVRLARWLAQAAERAAARRIAAAAIVRRLKFSTAQQQRVAGLAEHYGRTPGSGASPADIRRWLSTVKGSWRDVLRLGIADLRAGLGNGATPSGADDGLRQAALGLEQPEGQVEFLGVWRLIHGQHLAGPPLTVGDLAVRGHHLTAMGMRGPEVGRALRRLLDHVIEHPEENVRDRLLALARRSGEVSDDA